jgi:hypothetical protein
MARRIAVLSILLITTSVASAGDWHPFRRLAGPDGRWSYYGLDSNRAPRLGPNPGTPVTIPNPGTLNTSDLYRGYPYPGLGWYGPLAPNARRAPSVPGNPNNP